ncbi:MAG TPA: DedA family protein [Ktedonobacterales bacterium]
MSLILNLIATFGYVVVLLAILAESAGAPVPGETTLLVAGALAGAGQLWLPGVMLAAAAGAVLGDTAGYWIGRRYGLPLLRRHGRLFRFNEVRLEQAQQFFARHGDKTVFLGRFVPVGRIFSALLAGVSHMEYRRFLLWNATGGIVWAVVMGGLGYLFGQQLPLIERLVHTFGYGLLGALALAALVWLAVRRRAAWAPQVARIWQALAQRVAALRVRLTPAGWSPRLVAALGGLGALLAIGGGALALLLN